MAVQRAIADVLIHQQPPLPFYAEPNQHHHIPMLCPAQHLNLLAELILPSDIAAGRLKPLHCHHSPIFQNPSVDASDRTICHEILIRESIGGHLEFPAP